VSKNIKNKEYAQEIVKDFYNIKNVESLDLTTDSPDIISVAMCLNYVKETQLMGPKHILKPKRVNTNRTMILDRATIRNLELVASAYSGNISDSLFGILDQTSTRMGRRLLYSWILNPLIEKKSIDERLSVVEKFVNNPSCLEKVRESLSNVNDIDRIVGKVGLNRANGKDFNALKISLKNTLEIVDQLEKGLGMETFVDKNLMKKLIQSIEKTIADDPPPTLTEGGLIKTGYNAEVDELRSISGDSKSWLSKFEEEEKTRTGIPSLKISFNKVFGYYIEVTNTHLNKVPERYIRKQTLVNAERFVTEELKEKENIIFNAQEKIGALEYKIFSEFRDTFIPHLENLHLVAQFVSNIDVLSNFAYISITNNYVKPIIYEVGEQGGVLEIKKGRHPIVEKISTEEFISNDTLLNFNDSCMAILTGPNMSGKSTYIRQVATIVLMAQNGSFVPASEAKISIVDRIFTRVGASDDLSRGRSTFMVEMDEAANIINNATKYSLIVLDEVGRGTSTYDGVSIAWAIAEYLVSECKARTLFATHYHELLKLSEKFPENVQNYNVLVEEDLEEGTVIFLRKIVKGGTDRSYGIYVAKMAGLPMKIIKRANEILESFEQKSMFESENELRETEVFASSTKDDLKETSGAFQFPLFTAKNSEVEQEIQKLNLDNLTPLEALNKISEWKKKI
jgi:DNA mismatch repair protein MutS